MKNPSKKLLWAALLATVLACVILDLRPRGGGPSRLTSLPMKGLGYTGRDLPLNEAETAVFQKAFVLKRLYQIGPNRIVLLAVDGSGDRHAIHDPLYCFRGAGWAVTSEHPFPIPGGNGKILKLAKGSQTAEALCWFTNGENRHDSAGKAWWQSVAARFGSGGARKTPALLLLQPAAGGVVDWREALASFPELFSI